MSYVLPQREHLSCTGMGGACRDSPWDGERPKEGSRGGRKPPPKSKGVRPRHNARGPDNDGKLKKGGGVEPPRKRWCLEIRSRIYQKKRE